MLSFAEENYLKAIYHLSQEGKEEVSTNSISENLHTRPASVSDMVRKLALKGVINHKKYQGVTLTKDGIANALLVIRKHRLWEVFLVEKLRFNWDQVHEVAEQLEHIRSPLLIERLDKFLGHPKFDPHGDPIPDKNGKIISKPRIPLARLKEGQVGKIAAVKDTSPLFLQYMDKIGAQIGANIRIIEKVAYDGSLEVKIEQNKTVFVSSQVSKNILVFY